MENTWDRNRRLPDELRILIVCRATLNPSSPPSLSWPKLIYHVPIAVWHCWTTPGLQQRRALTDASGGVYQLASIAASRKAAGNVMFPIHTCPLSIGSINDSETSQSPLWIYEGEDQM